MKFNVGQVIYLLSKKSLKIIPSQIVEEIVRRKISGEEISYKIMLPDETRSIIDISKLDVEVFTDSDSIRTHMVENAVKSIDEMLEHSIELANNIFIKNKIEDVVSLVQDA